MNNNETLLSVGRSSMQVFTPEKIIKEIDNTITKMDLIVAHNEAVVYKIKAKTAVESDEYYHAWAWFASRPNGLHNHSNVEFVLRPIGREEYNNITHRYDKLINSPNVVLQSNETIEHIRAACMKIRSKAIACKKIAKADFFAVVSDIAPVNGIHGHQNHGGGFEFSAVHIPDRVQCQKCGDTVSAVYLSLHQETAKCKGRERHKIVLDKGYVCVRNTSKLGNLAKRGSIPSELIPIKFDTYVPKWVDQAAEMHDKNGKDYAGMSLEEFILRMAPPEQDKVADQAEAAENSSPFPG